MPSESSQNYRNHAHFVPLFHFVALPILIVNLVDSLIDVAHVADWENILSALVAFALVVVAFCARVFANTVQDRVIRLEERLRYQQLLPAELLARSAELTRDQYIALRFASDTELPVLMRTVLDQGITKRSEIKQMVKEWRGDYLRA